MVWQLGCRRLRPGCRPPSNLASVCPLSATQSLSPPALLALQVELFCISKLINCVLETDEEFVCMDFHFAVRAVRPRAPAAAQ